MVVADVAAVLDRFDPWLALDLNHFNAFAASDWEFYLGDRPLAAFAMACRSTAPLGDGALRDTITYAFAALLPGAAVELAVHQERAAGVDRILLDAGFVFDRPTDATGERGPLPSIFELPFAPGELQREMACRGGAESVLVRAFKPVDVAADARRIAEEQKKKAEWKNGNTENQHSRKEDTTMKKEGNRKKKTKKKKGKEKKEGGEKKQVGAE